MTEETCDLYEVVEVSLACSFAFLQDSFRKYVHKSRNKNAGYCLNTVCFLAADEGPRGLKIVFLKELEMFNLEEIKEEFV